MLVKNDIIIPALKEYLSAKKVILHDRLHVWRDYHKARCQVQKWLLLLNSHAQYGDEKTTSF